MEDPSAKLSRWYERWSLFEEPKSEVGPHEYPLTNFVYSNIFLLVCSIIVLWVLIISVQEWPTGLKVYTTNDPRPRDGYTCACSLPEWSGPATTDAAPSSLKSCYESEKLETVTVLQYDASMDLSEMGVKASITDNDLIVQRKIPHGYQVSWKATHLTLTHSDPTGFFDSLLQYKGLEFSNHDVLIDDILNSNSVLDIPKYYVRLAFQFDCLDCSTCGLSQLNKKISEFYEATRENIQWVSCSGEGKASLSCSEDNTYKGRCHIYPTSSVPTVIALQEFLPYFKTFKDIANIKGLAPGKFTPNAITLQISSLFLVESDVQKKSNITWGFLEVDEQHPWWLVLQEMYPRIAKPCREEAEVKLCKTPSICILTQLGPPKDDTSNVKTSCIRHVLNATLCKEMVVSTGIEVDYEEEVFNITNYYTFDRVSRICPEPTACHQVSTKYVNYVSAKSHDSQLIHEKENIHRMCTNVYSNVVRDNASNLLETSCINGLCRLTGRYNRMDDMDDEIHDVPQRDSPQTNNDSFICYEMKKKSKMRWTIDTFGVLFGWIGTMQLVFVIIFPGLVKIVKKVKEDEDASFQLDPL